MLKHLLALAVVASTFTAASLPATALPGAETIAVHIARTAGTCPASVAVRVLTTPYEGGATFDVRAQTSAVAFVSELASATPQRIAFEADLKPAYASCEGAGTSADRMYAFVLRAKKLRYLIVPGKGPNATYPVLLLITTEGVDPRVKMGFSD
jgi:hypothetical protein